MKKFRTKWQIFTRKVKILIGSRQELIARIEGQERLIKDIIYENGRYEYKFRFLNNEIKRLNQNAVVLQDLNDGAAGYIKALMFGILDKKDGNISIKANVLADMRDNVLLSFDVDKDNKAAILQIMEKLSLVKPHELSEDEIKEMQE